MRTWQGFPWQRIGGALARLEAVDAKSAASLVLPLGLSAILLWYFHDRFWWPVDDGVYAYVAQRLLAGDALHRDLIDLHGGYVNFLHALAFLVFGEDLVSLRYPLVALTLAQGFLAWRLLAPERPWLGATAALTATAFSFIQFLNPSANWYALFFFFLTCWALSRIDPSRRSDMIVAGLLLGLCFLFRQLSGVLLAMGAVTWLLLNLETGSRRPPYLARAVVAIMAAGLAFYLWSKGSLFAFLAFGVWPLGILVAAGVRVRADDRATARTVVWLAAGGLLAALPLLLYHLLEGSVLAWLEDIFVTAFLIHQQPFITQASFARLLLGAVAGLTHWSDPAAVLNGLLWTALATAPALLGWLTLRDLVRHDRATRSQPLPILAVFFALVAIHFEIPIYLLFAAAPMLVALLWRSRRWRPGFAAAIAMLGAIAIFYQAGQPLSRGISGILGGERIALDAAAGLPRASIAMEQTDQETFAALLDRIEAGARPDEALFTLPMDPELNFMTGRRAPVRYYGTPLGLRSRADVADTLARLARAAPLFVVHRRDDKYLTPLSRDLLQAIRRLDPVPEPFGPFDLYRLPASADGIQDAPRRE